jgi:hypothetical protein
MQAWIHNNLVTVPLVVEAHALGLDERDPSPGSDPDLAPGEAISNPDASRFSLVTLVEGCLENTHKTGITVLLPRGARGLVANVATKVLQITIPTDG